ncbi:MAG: hypothetical protein [Inoviridae sp.]|nr:MAG: hypothetical protein [Inoviridae sp.]
MRLLIYILALTSAFFVSAAEPDLTDLKTPTPRTSYVLLCGTDSDSPTVESEEDSAVSCQAVWTPQIQSYINAHLSSGYYKSAGAITWDSGDSYSYPYTLCKYGDCSVYGDGESDVQYGSENWRVLNTVNDYQCPPDGFSSHTIKVPNTSQSTQPTFSCAKPADPKDCPAGYHSKAVSKAMGSDSCMPKECPAAGSGEDLYSSKMTGGVPFNGGGMYCNDGCAYSVKSENVTSDQYALGTSQGAACGDKPYDNKKLSDEGDEGQCETNTVDGVTIMFCNNEPAPPTDKDDDANNDGSKEDETEKPKKDLEDCASDDNACMLRNLIKEQSNNTQVQIENDNKLHNKMVDTATNNTNVLKTAIDDLHTTVFVGLQKNDKLEAVKASKMNDLISAVREGNQILTDKPIGGGGGGGNGGGNGEGEGGGDCEGGAADCVPIAGSEIPKEIVNLSQYADKYDDWLPNAELPEEKCIVLTTGQSLCFSFSAFIILFQAISGLIVISSLLHSARIIAGAI